MRTLYLYWHQANTHRGKHLREQTAGCQADEDSSSKPQVVQPSEEKSAERYGAPAGAPTPVALQDSFRRIHTTAKRFWSNCSPTKNKMWKLQPPNNPQISLCMLRSATYGQGWQSHTCKALNSTLRPSASHLAIKHRQKVHRLDMTTAS